MNGVIYGNITNMTPLYNFIDDSYFAKMPVLRHLSQRLILSGFRLSVRKWQKIPGCEFLRLSPYSQNCYVTEQVFDEPL